MKSAKDYLEKLNQIYYGFIALPLLLYPVVYLPIKDSTTAHGNFPDVVYYGLGLFLFADLLFGWHLFQRNLLVISQKWTWEEKLRSHQKASMIFYGFGMVSCLVSVALLWLTKHQLFVATYPILLLVISFYRPTVRRLKRELPLTDKEMSMIKD